MKSKKPESLSLGTVEESLVGADTQQPGGSTLQRPVTPASKAPGGAAPRRPAAPPQPWLGAAYKTTQADLTPPCLRPGLPTSLVSACQCPDTWGRTAPIWFLAELNGNCQLPTSNQLWLKTTWLLKSSHCLLCSFWLS